MTYIKRSCPRSFCPCKQFSQVLSCGPRGQFHRLVFGPRLQVGCLPALSHSIQCRHSIESSPSFLLSFLTLRGGSFSVSIPLASAMPLLRLGVQNQLGLTSLQPICPHASQSLAIGHIQDVNKSDVHIHARSGALFEISAVLDPFFALLFGIIPLWARTRTLRFGWILSTLVALPSGERRLIDQSQLWFPFFIQSALV